MAERIIIDCDRCGAKAPDDIHQIDLVLKNEKLDTGVHDQEWVRIDLCGKCTSHCLEDLLRSKPNVEWRGETKLSVLKDLGLEGKGTVRQEYR